MTCCRKGIRYHPDKVVAQKEGEQSEEEWEVGLSLYTHLFLHQGLYKLIHHLYKGLPWSRHKTATFYKHHRAQGHKEPSTYDHEQRRVGERPVKLAKIQRHQGNDGELIQR